jgi:hypothetical protein
MTAAGSKRAPLLRVVFSVLVLVGIAAFIAVGCPSYRDGIPGQLAQAHDEAESAARSGALSLEFWNRERSTPALVSVQLGDARDEVIKAFKGIAKLDTEEAVDVERQRFLTNTMTRLIGTLNAARVGVEHGFPADGSRRLQRELVTVADSLANEYR